MFEVRTFGAHHDYAVFRCARELLEACGYNVTEDFYLTDLRKAIRQHESKQEYDRIPALQRKLDKLEPLLQQQANLIADARRLVLAVNFTTALHRVTTELVEVEGKIDQMKVKDHDEEEGGNQLTRRSSVATTGKVGSKRTKIGLADNFTIAFVLLLLLLVCLSRTNWHPTRAIDERQVLMELFHATGGSGWTEKDNWGTDRLLGTWHGVKVGEGGRVTHLLLSSNQLNGKRMSSSTHYSIQIEN
jgi:hypothetical protein